MAKDAKDPGTIDFVKAAKRREYLKERKRESRQRAKDARRQADPAAAVEVTLTIPLGAKAILEELAKATGVTMSAFVAGLVESHPGAAKARESRPGLFGVPHA